MERRVAVFGPAYVDRVLRVDRPLVGQPGLPPLDQSHEGIGRFAPGNRLEIVDPSGNAIEVALPDGWPGPTGQILLAQSLHTGTPGLRSVQGLSWADDLGGMGAGFAAALKGRLHSALGPEEDPTSREISELLAGQGIDHQPIRVTEHPADWTLLITSGPHGDKLPIGFRGCHAALDLDAFDFSLDNPCDVRVVASLPNRLAARVLSAPGARFRVFAPSMRNMRDRQTPLSTFAHAIDVLCCNRLEWEALEEREEVAWRVSILVVTDGPVGSLVRFTRPSGDPGHVRLPAFPRSRPPRDTNRAGEAFAAALVEQLLSEGWDASSAVIDEALIRSAMLRASAAAALVLDRETFGFPVYDQIEGALREGRVE